MPRKPGSVNEYLQDGCGRCEYGGTPQCKVVPWQAVLESLRDTLQQCGLDEQIKWGSPCYTMNGRNIVMLSALKESVTLSFFRGAEMRDPRQVLVPPGKNSRFTRYMRFQSLTEARSAHDMIAEYVREALRVEASGARRDTGQVADPEWPQELHEACTADAALRKAFLALTPGRQRGYLLHFNGAKQAATRRSRIEKCRERITAGKGWNER